MILGALRISGKTPASTRPANLPTSAEGGELRSLVSLDVDRGFKPPAGARLRMGA